ncbi:hypothetical protein [Parendozoicomonas sp. Alg238-R29]|nr:hypothetical protein [Parendozoicomonas sp. Alg238-R29]
MKAITFNPSFDSFSVNDKSMPEPGVGEARVKVLACGLNPVGEGVKE